MNAAEDALTARIVADAQARSGLATKNEVRRALAATMYALGIQLSPENGERLRRELPSWLGVYLLTEGHHAAVDVAGFYARVALQECVDIRFASEHAQAVCHAIARGLPLELLAALQRDLGPDLAVLFEQPAPYEPVARSRAHRDEVGRH